MRPPQEAPSWSQRVQARTSTWALVFYAVVAAWWAYVGIEDLAAGGPLWKGLISWAFGVGFVVLGARVLWLRARTRAWDAAHPYAVPTGPTQDEAARARRGRLRTWWVGSGVGVVAVVLAFLVDGDARGALLVLAVVIAFVLVVDVLRTDRPAEQALEPSPRVDA